MSHLVDVTIGKLFQIDDRQVKVLAMFPDALVQVQDLSGGKIEIVSTALLRPFATDAIESQSTKVAKWIDGNIPKHKKEAALHRFNSIKDALTEEVENSKVVKRLQCVLSLSRRSVYRLLAAYNEELGPLSLVEGERGRRIGAKLLDEQVESIVQHCIYSALANNHNFTYEKLHQDINKMCKPAGLKCPSTFTVRRRVSEYASQKQKAVICIGRKRATNEFRGKPGSLHSTYPLECVQMDHTEVDIILVDELQRLPIGRPWVTLAIDIFTRIIVGVYLSWKHPSKYAVACCFANMCTPKNDWLKLIGCEDVNYPFYGVCKVLHSDNAAEFKTNDLVVALDAHGIEHYFRREKHYGGHIERYIGNVMGKVHFLKGTTKSNPSDKGDYNSEGESCMTFSEFRRWLILEIEKYHLRDHKGLGGVTPKSIWNDYFVLEDGTPYAPPIVSDSKSFKLDFMPRKMVSVKSTGVVFEYLRYWDEGLRLLIGKKYQLVYNPESLRKVWLKIDGHYREIPYSDLMLPDTSLDQLKRAQKAAKEKGFDPRDEARTFEIMEEQERIEQESQSKTKAARKNQSRKRMRTEHYFENPLSEDNEKTKAKNPSLALRKVFFDD